MNEHKQLNDKRCIKTKKAITQALFELLEIKKISEISIKELAELAVINRKTFYNHYPSLDSVVYEIEDEIINRIIDILPETFDHFVAKDLKHVAYIDDLTDFLYEQRNAIRLLINGNAQMRLFSQTEKIINCCITNGFSENQEIYEKMDAYHGMVQATIFAKYLSWLCSEPQVLTRQQISDFIKNYIIFSCNFILGTGSVTC